MQQPDPEPNSPFRSPGLLYGSVLAALAGMLDAGLGLRLGASLAGGPADRLGSLLVGAGLAVAFFAVLAVLLWWPARAVASRLRWPVHALHAGVVVGCGLLATGLLWLEDGLGGGRLPVSLALAVGGIAALGALGAAAAYAAAKRLPAGGSRVGIAALGIVGLLALVVMAAPWGTPGERPAGAHPNVLLISLDTLRADHLGSYGYPLPTSPHLDALASQGARFERAFAPSHWTLPSHASMLTGLDPLALGVLDSDDALDERFATLAETLQGAGFRTAAFVSNGPFSYVGAERGFDQGFEEYHHAPYPMRGIEGFLWRTLSKAHWTQLRHRTGTASDLLDQVGDWLWARQAEPFFLFVHLYDIHSDTHRLPYESPRPFRGRFDPGGDFDGCGAEGRCASDLLLGYTEGVVNEPLPPEAIERMIAMYDEGIAYVDDELGRLFGWLEELGIRDDTLIVVTADHGESFFERGLPLHTSLHHEVLRVPLIVDAPGASAGVVVEEPVEMADLVPTVLDLMGLEAPPELSARSLAGWLGGPRGAAPRTQTAAFSEAHLSLRNEQWKLIVPWDGQSFPEDPGSGEEFYDLQNDPGERQNLWQGGASGSEGLEARTALAQRFEDSARRRVALGLEADRAQVALPDYELEALRALGYSVEPVSGDSDDLGAGDAHHREAQP